MTTKLSPADIAAEIRRLSEAAANEVATWARKCNEQLTLADYIRNHAEQIASALESKHHWSCRSVTMGDLCDCEAKRIAFLESDLERYREAIARLEIYPGTDIGEPLSCPICKSYLDAALSGHDANCIYLEVAAKRKESGK